jgi:hypothetical protein
MTLAQRVVFALVLRDLLITELHVGDCIGADEQATRIAQVVGVETVCHPPASAAKRAFTTGHRLILPARPYLTRDRDMVDAAAVLIAGPGGPEQVRSGTWYTVRYARGRGKPTVVIPPDAPIIGWNRDK